MTTSPDPYLLASTILTPDELPKLALVTYDPASAPTNAPSSSTPPAHTQRIFVIVSNISFNVEQCCVLVIKPRRKDPTTAVLLDVIPVLPDLKIEIEPQQGLTASAASPRNHPPSATTLGLSSLPQTLPTIHTLLESVVPDLFNKADSSNAALKFTLSHAAHSASGLTSDARGLKDFLSVLKDLLKVAQEQAFSSEKTHQWVHAYTDDLSSHSAHSTEPTPLDTPIFSRFAHQALAPSPASRQPARPTSPTASDIRVSVATFNVNSHLPQEDIPTVIGLKKLLRAEQDPDLIVLGFQEVDNSGGAYLYHTPAREDAWTRAVVQGLGRRADKYRKLASKQLVGLLILTFARVELELEEVATASVGVGLGGFVANKGAVAVRMKVGNRTLCFVNSHLSAFEGLQAMERRCWDWSEIYKRLRFRLEQPKMEDFWETPGRTAGDEDVERGEKRFKTSQEVKEETASNGAEEKADGSNAYNEDGQQAPTLRATNESTPPPELAADLTEASAGSITSDWRPPSSSPPPLHPVESAVHYTEHAIMEHDMIIHLGDLNFRLDLSHSEAHRLIRQRDYATLYRYDQLQSLRSAGSLFDDFEEGEIDFAPTYKFDKGTDRYDTSDKQRVPAWTDRIMWAVTSEWDDAQDQGQDQDVSATIAGGDGEGEGEKKRKETRQGVILQNYESVTDLKFSDHRPVRATFLVRIR